MVLRALGKTGIMVSPIGLGTVKLGRNTGVKYPGGGAELPTDEQATVLLRAAAELGVNLIDTAPAYGTSEERLGALMTANKWFGGRERWIVSTKAGEEFDAATGHSRFDFSAAAVAASVERSLRRLRTDRLDIVLLHSDGRDEWVLRESGGLGALALLMKQGKVRAVGISTKTVAGGLAALELCNVVMVTHNRSQTEEEAVIAAAAKKGVGVLVKKGLESGHAADPAASIRFVLANPGVSSLILGTSNQEHLGAAVRAAGK